MNRDYLGVAVTHPAQTNIYGQQALIGEAALIKQSLQRIFSTPIGSEFMNRAWGSNLHLVAFEPNDEVQQSVLEYIISEAVDLEKRVRYIDTSFTVVGPDELKAQVYYEILGSSEVDSFVFPFYRETRFS